MSGTRAWRIDTLDARGGLAFATWREALNSNPETAIDEQPCIFVGAPDFRAQPVANRAIALAAGRGMFQAGLFAQSTEMSFPTPDALVEFVRRTYVGSGAGDGTDGGGGGAAPDMRRPGGPELPRPPDDLFDVEGENLVPRVFDSIATFLERSQKLKPGEAAPHSWPRIAGHPEKFRDGPHILCIGALYLIGEVLRRFPAGMNVAALLTWQAMAHVVGRILTSLDLWPLLVCDPRRQSIASIVDAFAKQRGVPVVEAIYQHEPAEFRQSMALWELLFGTDPYAETPDSLVILPMRNGERSIDLCRTPLPMEFDKCVPQDLVGRGSLFHALCAFISAPSSIPHGGLCTLLLASSYIAQAGEGSAGSGAWRWAARGYPSPLAEARVAMHAKKGWEWLREQLPGFVFAQATEALIGSGAMLRYPRMQPVFA